MSEQVDRVRSGQVVMGQRPHLREVGVDELASQHNVVILVGDDEARGAADPGQAAGAQLVAAAAQQAGRGGRGWVCGRPKNPKP